jgi:uncharacterized protein YndB with AHSA1/START domain
VTEGSDQARVSVLVRVPQAAAFRIFAEEIDQWWRRGPQFRATGPRRGLLHLEPRVEGRLYEAFETDAGERVIETGRVTAWEPPQRLAFDWRAVNFGASEWTQVEVLFQPRPSGTEVTVIHSGWSRIRSDHPVRHGKDTAAFLRTMGLWWAALLTALREHAGK